MKSGWRRVWERQLDAYYSSTGIGGEGVNQGKEEAKKKGQMSTT